MTALPSIPTARRGLMDRWPRNAVASVLMLAAFLVFAGMAVGVRTIGHTIPIIEIIVVRQVVALALMAPIYWHLRADIARPQKLKLHFMRGITAVGAMACGLSSVLLIPLADATAIQMTEAIFATAFAALILREGVTRRQWVITAIGFLGALIMVQPFSHGFDWGALVALAGAVFGALTMITLRMGAGYDRVETVTFWQGLMVLALVLPVSIPFLVWPNTFEWLVLLAMSVAFAAGQWLFTAALRMGDTAALAPLHYLRLILMAAVGWVLYSEVPTLATVIGALLVFGAASVTLRSNARHVTPVPRPDAHH